MLFFLSNYKALYTGVMNNGAIALPVNDLLFTAKEEAMKKKFLISFSLALLGVCMMVVPLASAGQVNFYTYCNKQLAVNQSASNSTTKPSGTTKACNQLNSAYNTDGYPKSNQRQLSQITVNGQLKFTHIEPANINFTHTFSSIPSSATYSTKFTIKNDSKVKVTNSTSRYFQ